MIRAPTRLSLKILKFVNVQALVGDDIIDMFEKIYSFENLHSAYLRARRGKRYRSEILRFTDMLETNLFALRRELSSGTYRHGKYREFIVCDAKKRQIKAAPFRDSVIHHSLFSVIEPFFEKGFIFDSYACRCNKGVHRAVGRLQTFLRSARDREEMKIDHERAGKEKNYMY